MSTEPVGGGSPGPWRITFDTNPDDCNLACVMCEEHSEHSEKRRLRMVEHRPHRRMDPAIIRRVVSEMAPLGLREIIPSTMGDPLLYAHIDEVIAVCREFSVRLNLTTNGTWPRHGPVGWAERLCPVTSDVKISWNGVSARVQETIMKGSSNARRVEGLRSFLKVRDKVARASGVHCRVTLQCTFLESNLAELPGLVRFAAKEGVDRVKGHHLWVHFGEMAAEDLRRNEGSRSRWNEVVQECVEAAAGSPKPDGSLVMLENFQPLPLEESEFPPTWSCPFLGKEAWVNHAGRFDPCCAPDVERLTLGHFGSVTSPGGLRSIWDGSPYRALKSEYRKSAVCLKCTLRRPEPENA